MNKTDFLKRVTIISDTREQENAHILNDLIGIIILQRCCTRFNGDFERSQVGYIIKIGAGLMTCSMFAYIQLR